MINPFNGEGISCAMESGQLAAGLIGDALVRGRPGIAQMYPTILRQRYSKYYSIGNGWLRLIGNPKVMSYLVEHGVPRKRFMEFAMRLLANLYEEHDGTVDDRLVRALVSLAPRR